MELSSLAGAMLQVADDLVLVIKLVAEHPEVQLASIALPGLPSDVKGYVRGIETVVSGVRSTADAWDAAVRYVCSLGCEVFLLVPGDMLWSCSPVLHARRMHDGSYSFVHGRPYNAYSMLACGFALLYLCCMTWVAGICAVPAQ